MPLRHTQAGVTAGAVLVLLVARAGAEITASNAALYFDFVRRPSRGVRGEAADKAVARTLALPPRP